MIRGGADSSVESSESKKHRLTAPFKRAKRRGPSDEREIEWRVPSPSEKEREREGGVCECPGLDESGGKGGFFSRLEASGARSRGKGDEDGEKNDGERRSEASDRKGAEKRMEKEKEKEREGKRVGNNVVGAATGSYRWNPMAQSQEFSVFIGNFPSLLQVCSHKNTKRGERRGWRVGQANKRDKKRGRRGRGDVREVGKNGLQSSVVRGARDGRSRHKTYEA